MYLNPLYCFIIHFCAMPYTGVTEMVQRKHCRHDDKFTFACNYIPYNIPSGTLKFLLNVDPLYTFVLNPKTFMADNWRRLQYLELTDPKNTQKSHVVLQDDCFKGLDILKELHVHIWYPEVFKNTFSGLKYVNTLDLSACAHITMDRVSVALNSSNALPGLQKLVLTNWNLYKGSFAVNDQLIEMLLPRNITYLDFSYSQIYELNLTALCSKLTGLEFVNISYAIISDFRSVGRLTQMDMKHIKILDFTHVTLPKKTMPLLPGNILISNQVVRYSSFHYGIKLVLTPETVNISGIVPQLSFIWLENITLIINEDPLSYTKNVILRQNNLKKLDVSALCETFYFSSVENLDMSDNGMEFLHPAFLSCFRDIRSVSLSKNQLFKMIEVNSSLFQDLFLYLKFLRIINLSINQLQEIPSQLFQGGEYIENIDLSYNRLEQVTFDLKGLDNLKCLDLQGNNIHILNSLSTQYLNSIPRRSNLNIAIPKLILKSNPLSCSVCAAKPFLTWLIKTDLIDPTSQGLKCSSDTGKLENINSNTIKLVEKTCMRKIVIISCSTSAALFVLIQMACIIFIYKRYKHTQRNQVRVNVINNLRQGGGHYQFVTFLSFSSDDEEFVKTYILEQLNENLQLMTGIDRELVCTGDQHFRPGFYVHNEAFRQMDTASVVIVVVSNNFCASDYCRNELDQAYVKRKPIILMFIEQVEPVRMMPTMKELYQRNVRILWTVENGKHVLKTSWENVCTSILDLIKYEAE